MKLQVAEMFLVSYSRYMDSDEMLLWFFIFYFYFFGAHGSGGDGGGHCVDCSTYYFLGFIINCKYAYISVTPAKNALYFLRAK